MQKKIALACLTLAVTGSALAQQLMRPEEMIQTRQVGYRFMAWNMGKIKANLEAGYNKDQVVAAANLVAATANSGMGALYSPIGQERWRRQDPGQSRNSSSSRRGQEAGRPTTRKPNELARVAASGDAAAVKVQFGKTGEACKACRQVPGRRHVSVGENRPTRKAAAQRLFVYQAGRCGRRRRESRRRWRPRLRRRQRQGDGRARDRRPGGIRRRRFSVRPVSTGRTRLFS